MLGYMRSCLAVLCFLIGFCFAQPTRAASPCANGLECYTQALQRLQLALDAVSKPQKDIIDLTAKVELMTKKIEALQKQVNNMGGVIPILSAHAAYAITTETIDLRGFPNPNCHELPPPAGLGKFMQCTLPKPAPGPGRIIGAVFGRSPGCSGCSFEIGTVTSYNEDGGSMFVYRPAIDAGGHNQPWEWIFEILVVREMPPGK